MQDAFERMELMIGSRSVDRLGTAKIAVFGVGGTGSYVVEALARCGVGSLTLVDYDDISCSDINRQLYAGQSTVGHKKVRAAKTHIRDIDENILVHIYETRYSRETAGMFDLKSYDYIVDAMNSTESKLLLIEQAALNNVPLISCLRVSGRFNPSRLEISDISRVSGDDQAKTIRIELRKKHIRRLKVLYSREKLKFPRYRTDVSFANEGCFGGSISFVTGTAGMMIAGEIIRDILNEGRKRKGN